MKTPFLVTVVTIVLAGACATSPRAAPSPSPTVTPRDTTRRDTTRDTTRTRPDTSSAPVLLLLER